jgi:hypothetical protein
VGSPRSTKDPKGDGTLKFMAFYEYEPEDIDKVLEKGAEAAAIRQRDPERFPTVLFDFNIVVKPRASRCLRPITPINCVTSHSTMSQK